MSDWITDRLPTPDDADDKGWVATWTDALQMINYKNIGIGDPWYPLPKAYVAPKPPKPKRGVLWSAPGEWQVSSTKVTPAQVAYIEKLPTDPDWDELLEAIDNHDSSRTWAGNLKRIKEVRNRNE